MDSERMRGDGEALERVSKERQILACVVRLCIRWLFGHLLQFIGREVRRIGDGAQVRNEWCIDLSDSHPVNTVEEWVCFDLVYAEPLIVRSD